MRRTSIRRSRSRNTQGVIPNVAYTGGSTINGYGPYLDYNYNWNFFDNLNCAKGRHTVKFGYSMNRYNKSENNPGTPAHCDGGGPKWDDLYHGGYPAQSRQPSGFLRRFLEITGQFSDRTATC